MIRTKSCCHFISFVRPFVIFSLSYAVRIKLKSLFYGLSVLSFKASIFSSVRSLSFFDINFKKGSEPGVVPLIVLLKGSLSLENTSYIIPSLISTRFPSKILTSGLPGNLCKFYLPILGDLLY